jgi:hypothetical protein
MSKEPNSGATDDLPPGVLEALHSAADAARHRMKEIEARLHESDEKIVHGQAQLPPRGLSPDEEVQWWKRRVGDLSTEGGPNTIRDTFSDDLPAQFQSEKKIAGRNGIDSEKQMSSDKFSTEDYKPEKSTAK